MSIALVRVSSALFSNMLVGAKEWCIEDVFIAIHEFSFIYQDVSTGSRGSCIRVWSFNLEGPEFIFGATYSLIFVQYVLSSCFSVLLFL